MMNEILTAAGWIMVEDGRCCGGGGVQRQRWAKPGIRDHKITIYPQKGYFTAKYLGRKVETGSEKRLHEYIQTIH